MARPANEARFGNPATGIGGSWYDPPMPTSLEEINARWPQYAQRAAWLHQQYPSGKIGIAGTGFGWTQYFLFANHSRQSWGCDLDWAIQRAGGVLGAWASFVMAADVLNAAQMNNFRRLGNPGSQRYSVVLTGDLLPCMSSDAEVQTALANIRTTATTLVHLITPTPASGGAGDMLWHTPAEWRALIGPNDRIVGPDLVDWP